MAEKHTKAIAQVHHGEIRHSFYSPEFLEYPRGPVWYLVAGFIGLGIIALGVLSHAITLTLAFLVFVGVYWLLHTREAKILEISITQYGIHIEGEDFIPFGEISEFWFIYNPPFVADLKFKVSRKWNSIRTIHIFGQEPEELRRLLAPHVQEIERSEELSDLIVRALRI
ncbi:MAG: hypothetical protein K9L85_04300 [Candidatus Peribacteraceae bacterium]|nr:hypothetical protein [Candidatus Peribacteraceae bacterium]